MKKQTKLWTCKDGRRIRICDMSDNHLLNTIRFLEKHSKIKHECELSGLYRANVQGEMAQLTIDNTINSMEMDNDDPYELPLYEELTKEACRRNLKWIRF